MTTVKKYSRSGGRTSQNLETLDTSKHTVSSRLWEGQTLFPAVSRVNHSQPLAIVPEQKMKETSGLKCTASFAKLNPDGSWRKTSQGYSQLMMDGSLEAYCETWPRAGMLLNGIAYRLPLSELRTDETEFLLWPTPVSDGDRTTNYAQGGRSLGAEVRKFPTPTASMQNCASRTSEKRIRKNGKCLADIVRSLPTPQARDWKGTSQRFSHGNKTDCLPNAIGGKLNPEWVEWLMGAPTRWTDLSCLETARSFKLSNGSENK